MESFHDRQANHKELSPEKDNLPAFESITQKFLSSSQSHKIQCPNCGSVVDFNKGVIWHGPDTFTCSRCDRLLSIHLLQRALKDLGVE